MRAKNRNIAFLFVLALLVFIPLTTVSANAAPPSAVAWFVFRYAASARPSIQDLRLMKCESITCDNPAQFDPYNLFCHRDWCYLAFSPEHGFDYPPYSDEPFSESNYFKIVVTFSDARRTSNVLAGLPVQFGQEATFHVLVKEETLELKTGEGMRWPGLSMSLGAFSLTLFFETGTAFFIMWLLFRSKISGAIKMEGLVLVANMISYPILWAFFPAITVFHRQYIEFMGFTVLVFGLYFSIAGVVILNTSGKKRDTSYVVLAIFLLLLIVACCPPLLMGAGYSNSNFVTWGLSLQNGILLIELSAVVFETFLIYGLSKRAFPLYQVFVTSLIANSISFLIGLLFYNPW